MLLCCLIGLAPPALAQTPENQLLLLVNNFRREQGLNALTYHSALASAAYNHADWMARTGNAKSHQQSDGSWARDRARRAGYTSTFISEVIYLGGSSPSEPFDWWLNSPEHYKVLTSGHYYQAGIGIATQGNSTAYVIVFGSGSGGQPANVPSSGGGSAAQSGGQQAYVLGLDEFGNIKHEVQPGQTLGHILGLYGYTWDEYPYLLELNDMSEADRLRMQPGDVILVPPKAGTYTPAPAQSSAPATQPAADPAPRATEAANGNPVASRASTAAPREIRVSTGDAELTGQDGRDVTEGGDEAEAWRPAMLLGAAIVAQAAVLSVAGLALLRRWR